MPTNHFGQNEEKKAKFTHQKELDVQIALNSFIKGQQAQFNSMKPLDLATQPNALANFRKKLAENKNGATQFLKAVKDSKIKYPEESDEGKYILFAQAIVDGGPKNDKGQIIEWDIPHLLQYQGLVKSRENLIKNGKNLAHLTKNTSAHSAHLQATIEKNKDGSGHDICSLKVYGGLQKDANMSIRDGLATQGVMKVSTEKEFHAAIAAGKPVYLMEENPNGSTTFKISYGPDQANGKTHVDKFKELGTLVEANLKTKLKTHKENKRSEIDINSLVSTNFADIDVVKEDKVHVILSNNSAKKLQGSFSELSSSLAPPQNIIAANDVNGLNSGLRKTIGEKIVTDLRAAGFTCEQNNFFHPDVKVEMKGRNVDPAALEKQVTAHARKTVLKELNEHHKAQNYQGEDAQDRHVKTWSTADGNMPTGGQIKNIQQIAANNGYDVVQTPGKIEVYAKEGQDSNPLLFDNDKINAKAPKETFELHGGTFISNLAQQCGILEDEARLLIHHAAQKYILAAQSAAPQLEDTATNYTILAEENAQGDLNSIQLVSKAEGLNVQAQKGLQNEFKISVIEEAKLLYPEKAEKLNSLLPMSAQHALANNNNILNSLQPPRPSPGARGIDSDSEDEENYESEEENNNDDFEPIPNFKNPNS